LAIAALATSDLELSGVQRAAILVMYLDQPVARKMLVAMSDMEIREIGLAMAEVERVDSGVIEKVVADFVRDLYEISMLPRPGREFALDILPELVDDERRARVSGALRRRLSPEFSQYISEKPARAVASILQDEHPQTRAVTLVLMGVDNAARVMVLMDDQEQYDMALRMARLKEIPGDLADDVVDAIRQALEVEDADRWSVEGVDHAARVLGRLGKPRNDLLLMRLAKKDRDLSENLRKRMVTFNDLSGLDDRSTQAILKEIEREDLLLALKGTSAPMRDLFLRNMSSRASADLRDELEIMGPTPRSLVTRAQENIVEIALRLQEEGSIFLIIGGGDELV
jgi:flagellar motor switch protein FliG